MWQDCRMGTAWRCISLTQHQHKLRGDKVKLGTVNKRCLGGNPRDKFSVFLFSFLLFLFCAFIYLHFLYIFYFTLFYFFIFILFLFSLMRYTRLVSVFDVQESEGTNSSSNRVVCRPVRGPSGPVKVPYGPVRMACGPVRQKWKVESCGTDKESWWNRVGRVINLPYLPPSGSIYLLHLTSFSLP